MQEEWKDICNFIGYQVSNQGRVRTFWRRKHYLTGYGSYNYLSDSPKMMSQSDDGNGYMKLMLYNKNDGKRYCKKVHRLVAEAFIENDDTRKDTVDHIVSGSSGKLNNSVNNLRWVSRRENIKKAYKDGMCDERIRKSKKPIMATDLWNGEVTYFPSIGDAAVCLDIDRSTISHILNGDLERTARYTFEYAQREERLLYGTSDY
ncbi:endonuclease [Clostridia bacterium]|nr:endonuclease [Clostridia bacterium]